MNRGELRTMLSTVLNFNVTVSDQDFTTAQLNTALQSAYNQAVIDAEQHGVREYFKKTQQFTWPQDQLTYNLGALTGFGSLIALRDVTDSNGGMGVPLPIWWKEHNSVQWGLTGPTEDRTVEVHYFAVADTMAGDDDIPGLIPLQFHELLVWEAAVLLREFRDGGAPGAYQVRLRQWQERLWKHMSRGRVMEDVPRAGITGDFVSQSIGSTGDIPAQDGTTLDPF